jgi:hypothetical protein
VIQHFFPSFRGPGAAREPITLGSVVMDSGRFIRDRHYKMRISATADVRWRPGMTRTV